MTLQLTTAEIERYAPYHKMADFALGFHEYNDGTIHHHQGDSAAWQAYDRGAECAMLRQRSDVWWKRY